MILIVASLRIRFLPVLILLARGVRVGSQQNFHLSFEQNGIYINLNPMPSHLNCICFSATVVISSTGGAAEVMGDTLGQYEYDEDKECYVQSSTDQSSEQYVGRFLYYTLEYEAWVVARTIPSMEFWIMSEELQTDWMYFDGDTWKSDPSLTINPGPLPPLPSQFTVTTEVRPSSISGVYKSISGVYNKTERWWAGRPVYVNMDGMLLYHDWSWMIGDELGYTFLWGSQSHHSPDCERNWTYENVHDNETDEASVKIVPGDTGEVELVFQSYLEIGLIIAAIAGVVVTFLSFMAASYLSSKKKKAHSWTPPIPYSLNQSRNTRSGQLTPYSIQRNNG